MLLPYQWLFLWALGISLIISVMYRFLADQNEMRNLKIDMKHLKEKINKANKEKDLKKANALMSDMMSLNKKQLSLSQKPMIASLIVVGIILYLYIHPTFIGVKVNLPFWLPLFENDLGWLSWYVLASIPGTWIFRKFLGVE